MDQKASCAFACLITQSYLTLHNPMACTHQASLSMGFFRQEYWSGLPFPPPGHLPNPGIEPTSPVSPALQADSLPTKLLGKPLVHLNYEEKMTYI